MYRISERARQSLGLPSTAPSLDSASRRFVMTRKIRPALATLALLLGGGFAYAEPVTYVLQTPGVV